MHDDVLMQAISICREVMQYAMQVSSDVKGERYFLWEFTSHLRFSLHSDGFRKEVALTVSTLAFHERGPSKRETLMQILLSHSLQAKRHFAQSNSLISYKH
jgi:hypothetical protein